MDIYRIEDDLKFINYVGYTLNIEEKVKLNLALNQLYEKEGTIDQYLFWGKIQGTLKDYFIAVGLTFKGYYEFPLKEFFWCSSANFKFTALPQMNLEYLDKIDQFNRQFFTGQAEKILIQVPEEQLRGSNKVKQNEIFRGDQVRIKAKPYSQLPVKPTNLTELDRLAYVVRSIEVDCQALPIGAVKVTPSHEIRYNDSFTGLSLEDANKLEFYQHFRNVQCEEKKNKLGQIFLAKIFLVQGDIIFYFDFLDSLENDEPKGCWSIQSDSSKQYITLRNFLWPGYIGYHKANTKIFGGCYLGNGIKNIDLPFYL